MKGIKNKTLIVLIVFLVLISSVAIFLLIKNQGNNQNQKKYCSAESRNAEVCMEIYEPACGYPAERVYSNACFACMNQAVEYYILGECENE